MSKQEESIIEKAILIERAMRLTWSSLESHLEGTHSLSSTQKKYKKEVGDENFSKECVAEYSEVMFILSKLYG